MFQAVDVASSSDPNNPKSNFIYDPFEGFKIRTVDSWEMKEQHECEATSQITKAKSRTGKFKIDIQGINLQDPCPTIIRVISNCDCQGVQVMPLENQVVEGGQLNLTCRSKTKGDILQFSWRWLPLYTTSVSRNGWFNINETRLPAGPFIEIFKMLSINSVMCRRQRLHVPF